MAAVVHVFAGEYDLAHEVLLRAEFDTLSGVRNLILDMSAVTYLDSTCINQLLRLHNMRAAKGYPPLTIVRSAFIVKRLFSILYMGTFCRLVDTLDEALPRDGNPVAVGYACPGFDLELPVPAYTRDLVVAG